MKRGNTYTQLVTIQGIDLTAASEVVLTVKPLGHPPMEWTGETMSISADSSGTTIAYKLTEEQSLSFGTEYRVDVNWMLDGNRGGTAIERVPVSQTLLNRIIGGGSDTPDPDATEPDVAELTTEEVRVLNAISPKISSITHSGSNTVVVIADISGDHVLAIPDGQAGVGIASVTLNDDYTLTITYTNGDSTTTTSIRGGQGAPGQDGFSPIIVVTDITGGHRVSITDAQGTQTFDVPNGQDGVSPVITVMNIQGGHRVTITDAEHPSGQSFDVLDGDNYVDTKGTDIAITYIEGSYYIDADDGEAKSITSGFHVTDFVSVAGKTKIMFSYPYYYNGAIRILRIGYAWYDSSENYVSGQAYMAANTAHVEDTVLTVPAGAAYVRFTVDEAVNGNAFYVANVVAMPIKQYVDKVGVPAGGTQGQMLVKKTATDYDTEWQNAPTVPVQDVQVNGTSILDAQGVANVPIASASNLGAVKINTSYGINIDGGALFLMRPSEGVIKAGTDQFRIINPNNQHISAFYALAKAAGADMAYVRGATVGIYPEAQKSAISQMLSAPVPVTGTTPTITALSGIQYVCGEVSTLDIIPPASGCFDVIFESGSTPTALTISNPTGTTVEWLNDFDSTNLLANAVYEINLLRIGTRYLGVAGAWS